jgi:hypothetical protein
MLLALAACGGGGDSTTTTPPTSTALSLSGTVATGAALAGATVSVSCASGTDNATTSASGTYSLSLTNGSLPCVLTATSADSSIVLHSVAAGTGSGDASSNITPLSELLVAQLAGSDPANFVAGFNSSTTISSNSVAAAQTTVLQALSAAGLDTSSVTDILSGSITAGSGSGYDGVLDSLQVKLADASTDLATLTSTVASASTAGSTTSTSTVSTLLAPANSDCPALKSGTHRVIDLTNQLSYTVAVDASALTAVIDASTYHLTKNSRCDYTLDDSYGTRVLVAKSGMAVWRHGSGLGGTVGISLPAQTLDLAALAGVYNRVSYTGAASDSGDFGTVTFNAAGVNTTSTNCAAGYGSCTVDPNSPFGHLAVNADGGYDYIDDGAGGIVGARVFAFRNDKGHTMMVAMESGGGVTVLGNQSTLPLPAVGDSGAFWQFTVTAAAGLGDVSEDGVSYTAVDAATGVATRQFTSDSHFDTITFNDPYPGLRYRATNACTSSAGGAFSCSGVVQMPLPGSGITLVVSSVPTKHFIAVSVSKP